MPETPAAKIEAIRLAGPVPYREAYEKQIARRERVESGDAEEALFLLEHTPVLTQGRSASDDHVLESRETLDAMGIEVVDVDRGGDVTYHGPGQLVAYPVLNLTRREQSIKSYLRTLEEVIIGFLADYGLKGERVEGFTGVWIDGAKVAAIGVGLHNWVTYHGIAINVDPDMDHFNLIVPCGIPDKPVTSLERLLEEAPSMEEAFDTFEKHFNAAFTSPTGTSDSEAQ